MTIYDICIIGGGAAGLTAAASIHHNLKGCVLEKNEVPGRKLMATGGGRCNITNRACDDKEMALEFFKSMGLETHEDPEGRYYPYSNQAADVVKTLLLQAQNNNVEIITQFAATEVQYSDGHFIISDAKGRSIAASRVLLAPGGKAAPQFGTTGDGYGIARAFGHTINKVYPILTGITCGDFRDIKGVRARGKVSLYRENRLLAAETGEIQFTADGLSGICVMNLTMHIRSEDGEPIAEALQKYQLKLDLAPDFTASSLAGRSSAFGIVTEKLAARISPNQLKDWRLPVKGVKGWKDAQCTAGGVALEEIDIETMESKLRPGLYFAGEILDRQGPCGGFNLQNAWETGLKAARAINEEEQKRT